MKNIIFLLVFSFCTFLQAQYTQIPDSGFEQMLINQGIDSDGIINSQVLTSDIDTITNLNIHNIVGDGVIVSDLTGIEDFIALEILNCGDNALTQLHLNNNIALRTLDCSSNIQLIDIDITNNINLEYINCSSIADIFEGITIDFSQNINLEFLWAENSSFNSLDLSNNVNLKTLICRNDLNSDFGLENIIISLDLSQNTSLEYLECNNTSLETLMLPNTNSLTFIKLQLQQLNSIDISQNQNLEYLDLNINPNLTTLEVTQNPYLNFLDVNKCALTNLDVSQNLLLTNLSLGYYWVYDTLLEPNFNNDIQSINLSNNINLITFNARKINLDVLDVSHNINLQNINLQNNNIIELSLIHNTQLKSLVVNENSIETLDLSNNNQLEFLFCEDTALTTLNLKSDNNQILNQVFATNNPELTCIEVDDEVDANNNAGFYINWQKDATTVYSEDCETLTVDEEIIKNVLYPNPTKNRLFIANEYNINIEFIKIYNMFGKQVLTKKDNFNQINLTKLKPAMYLVNIKTKKGFINLKIIKQ